MPCIQILKLFAFLHEAGQREPILRVVLVKEDKTGEERLRVVAEPQSNLLLGRLWSNLIVVSQFQSGSMPPIMGPYVSLSISIGTCSVVQACAHAIPLAHTLTSRQPFYKGTTSFKGFNDVS
eukprot:1158798-Pelagomonas_calceolata.AAC.7